MPVVVTGASGAVGRAVIPLLVERGSEVRAVLRSPAAADVLRGVGAKVAVCRLGDADALEAVLDGAHTVIHLAGGLDFPDERSYEEANLGTTRSVLEAAVDGKVARFLFLSYPGASAASTNPYLRAKGRAEDEVRATGLDHFVLRSTHIYGPGCRWLEEMAQAARRPLAVVIGPGTQRLAPAFLGDVARLLVAADDRAVAVTGTFGFQGPDQVTADQLVDLLAGRPRRKLHLRPETARRAARLGRRRLSSALLEVLAADSLADAPDAAAELGLTPTPLRSGLAAS